MALTFHPDNSGVPPLAYAERGNHEAVIALLLEPKNGNTYSFLAPFVPLSNVHSKETYRTKTF
jgi:ankyrin repeat protein